MQPVVRVRLKKEGTGHASELYAAIPNRHTNRGRYVPGKKVDERLVDALTCLKNSDSEIRIFWFRQPEEMRAFGDLVVQATEAVIGDEEQSQSSARWLHTKIHSTFRPEITSCSVASA